MPRPAVNAKTPLSATDNLPPLILIVLVRFPKLPSDVNLTSAIPVLPSPLMLIGPLKVFAVLVISKRPVPFVFAVNVIPLEPVFEIIPLKV